MRKLASYNLSALLFFALVAAAEASVQTESVQPRPLCLPLDSSTDSTTAPADNAALGTSAAFCSFQMPRLVIDTCVGSAVLGSRGPVTLYDLAEAAGLQRRPLPEPATIAVWSLIGLCWGGVSCWRWRRGLAHNGGNWNRPQTRRRAARPPWPDHVRARIIEIIERGATR
jgi:hypothetical protein